VREVPAGTFGLSTVWTSCDARPLTATRRSSLTVPFRSMTRAEAVRPSWRVRVRLATFTDPLA
jgi:hypothetical protein